MRKSPSIDIFREKFFSRPGDGKFFENNFWPGIHGSGTGIHGNGTGIHGNGTGIHGKWVWNSRDPGLESTVGGSRIHGSGTGIHETRVWDSRKVGLEFTEVGLESTKKGGPQLYATIELISWV